MRKEKKDGGTCTKRGDGQGVGKGKRKRDLAAQDLGAGIPMLFDLHVACEMERGEGGKTVLRSALAG